MCVSLMIIKRFVRIVSVLLVTEYTYMNFSGNGIKFTRKGEVVVSVSVKSKSVDTVELLFAVKDTGTV